MSFKRRFKGFSFSSKGSVLILLIAGLLSGCSSDFSRFTAGITPSHKKAQAQQAESYPPAPAQGAPVSKVESSNLAPPAQENLASANTAPSASASSRPVSQTAAVKSKPAVSKAEEAKKNEDKEGRRTITYTVVSGDSLIGLAERYHILVAAIKRDNNLKGDKILIGQKLTIKKAKIPSEEEKKKKAVLKAPEHNAEVKTAESVNTAPSASGASAAASSQTPENNMAASSSNSATSQSADGGKAAAAGTAGAPSAGSSNINAAVNTNNADTQTDTAAAQSTSAVDSQNQPVSGNTADNSRSTQSSSAMIWPVRGNIISSYGQRAGTATNDGIDIAVPEGTSVKAAAAGQVIYAGDGLKEFGNTILIRHEDNVVTVYGHNSKLLVQRGQQVQKGQEIALSGSSGNASVAKLHFEVRKNSAPVNPMNYLPSTQ